MGLDGLRRLGHQRGAFVDQAGVQLHGVCTRFNLGHGIFPAQDAARANDGKACAQRCAQLADDAAADWLFLLPNLVITTTEISGISTNTTGLSFDMTHVATSR